MVSDKRFAVAVILIPFLNNMCFSLLTFKIFCLSCIFISWNDTHLFSFSLFVFVFWGFCFFDFLYLYCLVFSKPLGSINWCMSTKKTVSHYFLKYILPIFFSFIFLFSFFSLFLSSFLLFLTNVCYSPLSSCSGFPQLP